MLFCGFPADFVGGPQFFSRTRTSVTPLSIDGRVNELARIMGGIAPTDATLAAARDLLSRGTEK